MWYIRFEFSLTRKANPHSSNRDINCSRPSIHYYRKLYPNWTGSKIQILASLLSCDEVHLTRMSRDVPLLAGYRIGMHWAVVWPCPSMNQVCLDHTSKPASVSITDVSWAGPAIQKTSPPVDTGGHLCWFMGPSGGRISAAMLPSVLITPNWDMTISGRNVCIGSWTPCKCLLPSDVEHHREHKAPICWPFDPH